MRKEIFDIIYSSLKNYPEDWKVKGGHDSDILEHEQSKVWFSYMTPHILCMTTIHGPDAMGRDKSLHPTFLQRIRLHLIVKKVIDQKKGDVASAVFKEVVNGFSKESKVSDEERTI